jgi:Fis family transcriptional regulator
MSKKNIEDCVRDNLLEYFRDLHGEEPHGMHDMLIRLVEKPLLEVVMAQADTTSRARRMAGPEPQHLAQEADRAQLLK